MTTFAVVQEYANGPWRWAMYDDDGHLIGRSHGQYQKAGNAENALFSEVLSPAAKALTAKEELPISRIPSVQFHLFGEPHQI